MPGLLIVMSVVSITLCGAIFGFFYAWLCSTMWGLDQADPRIAIAAMQAMNASVRNLVFAPAFFLTPLALAGTAAVMLAYRQRSAAAWFLAAGLIYAGFGLVLTMTINVPMNEALATIAPVPSDAGAARDVWTAYSGRWQFWNMVRTVASGLALACAAMGLMRLRREPVPSGDASRAIPS